MGFGDFYATKTPTRLGSRSKQVLNRRLLKRILRPSSGQSSRILEIGSGHGFFAKACVEADHDYSGIEPHPVLHDHLRQTGYLVRKAVCPPIPGRRSSRWIFEHIQYFAL